MDYHLINSEYEWKEPKTVAHDYVLPYIMNLLKLFNISQDALILDAGCGGGYVMSEIYKKGFKNIYGFDASRAAIKIACKNYEALNFKDRVALHDAYNVELPPRFPQKYNVVLSVEVVEHMYSPHRYLNNINIWLKNEGILILTTPYHGYLKNLAIAIFNKFDAHVNSLCEGWHIKFFSKRTICRLLNETGFSPIKFYGSGRFPYLWRHMIVAAKKNVSKG